METIQKYNQPSDWVESFLSTFSQNYQRDIEKEAETNVKTLPKVVWNDNTFYVSLDANEQTADVFNEYGNVVTTLKNITSVADVEQQLNKQIVANIVSDDQEPATRVSTSLDDELDKVAQVLNLTKSADGYAFQPDSSTQNTQTPQNQEMGNQTEDPSINKSNDTVTNTPDDTSSGIADQQMNSATMASLSNSDALKELETYKNKIANLETQVSQMASTIQALTDEIHAYINPGNIYDLQSADTEFNHYTDTARQSAHAIDIEHAQDLTIPAGRVSLKDKILQDIDSIFKEDIMPTNIDVELETEPAESVEIVIDTPKDNTSDESLEFSETELDNISDEDLEELNDTINDDLEELLEEELLDEDLPDELPEELSEEELLEEDLPKEDSSKGDLSKDDLSEEKLPEEDKVTVVKLSSKDSARFKKRICPICGKSTLCLGEKTASKQGILCKDCKSSFEVDLNTEEIFQHTRG